MESEWTIKDNPSNTKVKGQYEKLSIYMLTYLSDFLPLSDLCQAIILNKKTNNVIKTCKLYTSYKELENRYKKSSFFNHDFLEKKANLEKFICDLEIKDYSQLDDKLALIINKYIHREIKDFDISKIDRKNYIYLFNSLIPNKSITSLTAKFDLTSINTLEGNNFTENQKKKIYASFKEMIKHNKGLEKISINLNNYNELIYALEETLEYNNTIKNITFFVSMSQSKNFVSEKIENLFNVILAKGIIVDLKITQNYIFNKCPFDFLSILFTKNKVESLEMNSMIDREGKEYSNMISYYKTIDFTYDPILIKKITIRRNANDFICYQISQFIPKLYNLEYLEISSSTIPEGLSYISDSIMELETNLKSQDIIGNLITLNFSNNPQFLNCSIEKLCHLLKNCKMIHSIDLTETDFINMDIKNIFNAVEHTKNKNLREIKIFKKYKYNNELFPLKWSIIGKNSTLENFSFKSKGIDDDVLCQISQELKYNQSLLKLTLSYNHFTQNGFRQFVEAFKNLKLLTELNLSNSDINDDCMEYLSKVYPSKNNTLTKLNLSSCKFTDDGFDTFCRAIFYADKNNVKCNLRTLKLQENPQITSEGIIPLFNLIKLNCLINIIVLDISQIKLESKAQIALFSSPIYNSSIEKLSISLGDVDEKSGSSLQRMLDLNHTLKHFIIKNASFCLSAFKKFWSGVKFNKNLEMLEINPSIRQYNCYRLDKMKNLKILFFKDKKI